MYGGRRKLTVPKNKKRLHTRFNSGQKRAGIYASRSYTYLNRHPEAQMFFRIKHNMNIQISPFFQQNTILYIL